MTNHVGATAGCLLAGEYVDEGECPTNLAVHQGEVVRPPVVANYLDLWARYDDINDERTTISDWLG